MTEIIHIDSSHPEPEKIKYAAEALKKGRLVVFPTETVYGIGANTENKCAMARLKKLKERPKNPFSYHVASKSDLKKLGCIVGDGAKKIIDKYWPGPLTIVLPTRFGKPIGVRMPKHPVALALLKQAGIPVVAPSANFKDETPATDAEQAAKDLNGLVDIVINSGKTEVGVSSTVLDMTQNPPKVLRQGSIKI